MYGDRSGIVVSGMKDRNMKRRIMVVTAAAVLTAAGCSRQEPEPAVPMVEDLPTQHETEFGGVYIGITIDAFNERGFIYGDSVDVVFSNGYALEDIPYYNGYYVDAGQPLLIAYPGYEYIKAAINYGDDLWERAGLQAVRAESLWIKAALDEHSTATVTLRERGKYADIQEARDIHYTDIRTDYPSDEAFANFRNIRAGRIRPGILFRSASPCDNQHMRAPYVDRLMADAGVNGILNLSDNMIRIDGYLKKPDFDSPYFLELYEADKVIPIALNMNYLSEEFAVSIANGFIALSQQEGPYLIHCTEGKDRTGFVCMLAEAMAGASYQEIADDYMETYANYYRITEIKEPVKYRTILEKNLDAMITAMIGDESVDIRTADLALYAREYLLAAGMTGAQIDLFLERISE